MQVASEQDTSPQPDHQQMANAIRALAMDAVEAAKSGHPGMPMGMADVATVLYSRFLKFDPGNPDWPDRDRFVLSAGHGSMLLYALNYLTGYAKMSMEDLKNFRQLHSITAGHPEVDVAAGIETTTGPLGQGISNAVGFALAERILNARFGDDLVDHYTYVIASDGDLMEGISHESCALAGHLKLGKLIVLYDDNGITIDGPTELAFTEDTHKRFEAYGWETQQIDGHNPDAVVQAIDRARKSGKPSLIACKTRIGYGAPTKEGSADSHGAPLGEDEIRGTRDKIGWPHGAFEIPEDILEQWRQVGLKGRALYEKWRADYEAAGAQSRDSFTQAMDRDVNGRLEKAISQVKASFAQDKPSLATRKASGKVLEYLIPVFPELVGGSADLTGSNNTRIKEHEIISAANSYHGQYIHYGVREHGMAAAMNGMTLHGGIFPYGGTFLTFSDYCRPSIRLAALMETPTIFVMTHDSIGLGEDGPTHQPVEHLAALRSIPNLNVFRPCDGLETAECWELAIRSEDTPSLIALTRQNLATLRGDESLEENLTAKGGYILADCQNTPDVILYASGSEVEIAMGAKVILEDHGIAARLVSVPCFDLLEHQEQAHVDAIIGPDTALKVAVEAGVRQGWDALIGREGLFVGMESFGASGPYEELYAHFGITAESVADKVRNAISR